MHNAPWDAVAFLSLFGRRDGIQELRWALADGSRRTTYAYYPFDREVDGMGAGPNLLQRTWDKLDEEVSCIKNPHYAESLEWHKARATAIAEILAMFMPPHFTTTEEISREALRRWEARQVDDFAYETAGLGSRKFEPPPGLSHVKPHQPTRKAPRKTTTPPTGKRVPDSAVPAVKQALETKMFTVAQIAKTYSMSEAEVKDQFQLRP